MPTDELSNINAIGLSFILVMGVLMFVLPRRFTIVPIIVTTCYITIGQVVVIASLHFSVIRILVLFGWARLVIRREISGVKVNAIDKALISWVIAGFVIYNLREQTYEAFVNQLGFAYNAIGMYFLFRFFIRDFSDLDKTLKAVALIIIPLALAMLAEHESGRNIFSIFGGVQEITAIRDGKLRCQGPFRHPILAGTFGATLVPLFIGLWFQRGKPRLIAIAGTVAASIMTMTATSSGAVMAYVAGIAAMAMWPFRKHMRAIRWGILFILVSLHLIMKAPVWYLMSHVGDLIGGHGWHRSYLIDTAIKHFDEWWLLGTKYTLHWMPYGVPNVPGVADITNQFIGTGVDGGLFTLILFIGIIVFSFRCLGRRLRAMEDQPTSLGARMGLWSMGAALFAHIGAFMGVTYFDQIIVIWYLLLAMISSAYAFGENQNCLPVENRAG